MCNYNFSNRHEQSEKTGEATASLVEPLVVPSLFSVFLADPPWRYRATNPPCLPEKQPEKCGVQFYYPTMSLAEIKAMPISDLSTKDSVLFLWATVPMLPEALEVMKTWGWKYTTMITWHKTNNDCMGYWFRVCTEHLLVGIRGKVKSFRSMERTLFETPRGKHSQKPEKAYKMIEAVTEAPRLELFARQKRQGWFTWGNEVENNICL